MDLSLASLSATDGFRVLGGVAGDFLGWSGAGVGDINGDGIADMLLGAPNADAPGLNSGAEYLIFGRANGFSSLDLATLGAGDGRVYGNTSINGQIGLIISAAGDFNGDGRADFLTRESISGTIRLQLLYGSDSAPASGNLDPLAAGSMGVQIQVPAQTDFGRSVAQVGDLNGDGFSDLIIGDPLASPHARAAAGITYIVFGRAENNMTVFADTMPLSDGFTIAGAASFDQAGTSVTGLGDFNRDGFDDVAILSRDADPLGRTNAGSVHIIFGKASGFAALDLATLAPADGFVVQGVSGNENIAAVGRLGDVNGDGFADLLVSSSAGDPLGRQQAGTATIVYGKASGFATLDLAAAPAGSVTVIQGRSVNQGLALETGGGGDINGDGLADILLGTALITSYVVMGQASDTAPLFLDGSSAANTLRGGALSDTLRGLAGNDVLLGFASNDTLLGGVGDDTLQGGLGEDMMDGGTGNDTYEVDSLDDAVLEQASGGTDAVYVYVNGHTLAAQVEVGRLEAGTATSLIGNAADNVFIANALASTISGLGGDDVFYGQGGADSLDGGAGDDIFYTGGGADSLIGAAGNDQAVIYDAGVTFTEMAGQGTDTAWVGVSGWTLGPNIEIIRLFGAAASVTGNGQGNQIVANVTGTVIDARGGDDEIYGQGGNDTVDGGLGNDILYSGGGNDAFTGGAGNDQFVILGAGSTFIELPGEGTDTAWVAVNGFTVQEHVEIGRLAVTATQLNGGNGAQQLVANPVWGGMLSGGAGDDVLWGSGLADTFNGGRNNDVIYAGAGADIFTYDDVNLGVDQVADFSGNWGDGDRLDLRGSGTVSLAGVTMAQGGGNTQISFGSTTVLLHGVTQALLASDFIFA